ncbi:flagellar motor switch protein FliM [Cerasibacillus terrae]|uniref:Flagellar motor switch protein FliM n=1 Tax=Cerasibacillus terrae TaxID=2498845 RepID=A0A5C8P266_9BACI|nr:flagellar motor switch protein FliM [Cerasibacillus terrae]TXL67689.1 flagellar motor switch protein FliM [Cerasibacillus terrae]
MVDEVLSQSEIDALLSALSTGEMDAEELKQEEEDKKIRVYDFKRALRFSKDQVRSIGRIHENYARLLTTFFSGQLRTYVNISVASVDQIPYEEFIRSVPRTTILNVFRMDPLDGTLIMEINPNIAYTMLDRLLGGQGNTESIMNELTEIETVIMTQLFEKTSPILKEAWASLIDVDPILDDFENNPQFLQMVSPNETVIVVSFNTTIGDVSGMINICIPHMVLEPIIPKLSVHYQMQTSTIKGDLEAVKKISKNLQQSSIEMKAILGETRININQFLHLMKDDFITLDKTVNDPLLLLLNDVPKFNVQLGKVGNHVSVQVLEEIKGGVVHDE